MRGMNINVSDTITVTESKVVSVYTPPKLYMSNDLVIIDDGSETKAYLPLTPYSEGGSAFKESITGPVTPPTTATEYELHWYTRPLNPVTIRGNVTFNIWAYEDDLSANATITAELYRTNSNGDILSTIATAQLSRAELTTSSTVQRWTVTPTATNIAQDERLLLKVFIDDGNGVTMTAGTGIWLSYALNVVGSDGDSYVTLTENITESSSLEVKVSDDVVVTDGFYYLQQTINDFAVSSFGVKGGTAGSGQTSQALAQQFVATGTKLSKVRLILFDSDTTTDDVIVNIVATLGGTSLGSATVTASSINNNEDNYGDFVFSTPIVVTNGGTYYIQVTRSGARDETNFFQPVIADSNAYTSGDTYTRSNNIWSADGNIRDMYFVLTFDDARKLELISHVNKSENINVNESTQASLPNALAIAVSDYLYLFEGTKKITNSSFENDTVGDGNIPSGWRSFNTAGTQTYKGVADDWSFDGTKSFKMTATSATDTGIKHDFTGLPPGATVTATAYVRTSSDTDGVTIVLDDTTGGSGDTNVTHIPHSANGRYSVSRTVAATGNITLVLGFGAYGAQSDGTVWFDDVQLFVFDKVELNSFVNKSESISLSETGALSPVNHITVNDAVTVSENVATLLTSNVTTSETITMSEVAALDVSTQIAKSDSITVTDTPTIAVQEAQPLSIQVSEQVAINEQVTISAHLSHSVSDTITVTEQALIATANQTVTNDTITATDTPVVSLPITIAVADSVAVTESTQGLTYPVAFVVNDSVSITDTPNIFRELDPFVISVSDSISTQDVVSMNPPHLPDPAPRLIFVDGELAILIVGTQIPHYTKL